MNHSLQTIMTFAIANDGRAVHINEVQNGAKCGCSCPACHSPLIAKNEGEERAHHFAHDGRMEEHSCSETALHFAAKQIIADNKKVMLPSPTMWAEGGGIVLGFCKVILEHRLASDCIDGDHIVADCLGINGNESLIIEIAVHHQVDLVKSKKIQQLNIPSIEIGLTDFADRPWDWKNLTHEVLFSSQRRKWLWQPESATADRSTEVPLSNQLISHKELKEWKFDVDGSWVWVKELPFGNIKIFHRPSDYARRVVEPICRNRGYWNPKYKSWIVFDQFKDEVLKYLTESGRLLN